mmetsp:Transcript_29913/g.96524  ORF Transcript_29913/g.96524 Transcript_29913/m.96524 type:complete len:216 (-) Transcript_29913:371-1018(-)
MAPRMMLFTLTIWHILSVRSSSLDPIDASAITEGRMGTGGTSRCSTNNASGLPCTALMSSRARSLGGMARSSSLTRTGFKSSAALGSASFRSDPASWPLSKAPFSAWSTIRSEAAKTSRSPRARSELSFGAVRSCTTRAKPTFFTLPFRAAQWGQSRTFLQASTMRLNVAEVRMLSPLVRGWARLLWNRTRSSGLSSTREHVLQMHCRTASIGFR